MSEDCNQQPDTTPGVFAWNELAATDTDKSMAFYSDLFGWKSQSMDMPNGKYTMFMAGDRPVAGMMTPPEECEMPSMWLSYINVDNIETAFAKAKELGAEALSEIVDIPEKGSFAVIKDPTGAVFGLWKYACAGN